MVREEKKERRGERSSCDGLQRVGWRGKGKAGREERVRGTGYGRFKTEQTSSSGEQPLTQPGGQFNTNHSRCSRTQTSCSKMRMKNVLISLTTM